MLKPIYKTKKSPMNVAVFISGSGSNAVKLLEREKELEQKGNIPPFKIAVLFTDNKDEGNNTWKIARRFGLSDPIYIDFKDFAKNRIKDARNFAEREPYFKMVLESLITIRPKVDFIALAGYRLIITEPLLSAFRDRIVNVHPADLSIRYETGRPVFVGDHVVLDAILAGQREIRSTTHLVIEEMDQGSLLLISDPVKVNLPKGVNAEDLVKKENRDIAKRIANEHQSELKERGDWIIFPLTVELIAKGQFGRDESGLIYLNSIPVPNGIRMKNLVRMSDER